jgi:hypothetical protein
VFRGTALTALAAAIVVAGAAALMAHAPSAERTLAAPALTGPCPASHVTFGAVPAVALVAGLPTAPWIASSNGRFEAALLYYGSAPSRFEPHGATIGADGKDARGMPTKVFWWVRGGGGSTMQIQGRRLDAAGSFTQTASSFGGSHATVFTSTLRVPAAGCWRLHLTSGDAASSVTFKVVAATPAGAARMVSYLKP